MTELDHLAVVAPDLATGVAWVRDVLGVDPPEGGSHPEMGTHNHLLRIGNDIFLEVIAVDPEAPRPRHRRWFGLDDGDAVARRWQAGHRLRAYIARCEDVGRTIGPLDGTFGAPMQVSRGDRRWTFAVREDGEPPLDGALPCLIDWGARGPPASAMQDHGLELQSFVVDTPFPDSTRAALDAIGMGRQPEIRKAGATRLTATIATPHGVRTLS